jgi:hypothetical protein
MIYSKYPRTVTLNWRDGSVTKDAIDWPAWFSTAPQIQSVAFRRTGVDTHEMFPCRFTTTSGHKFTAILRRDGCAYATVRYKEVA